MNDVSNFVGSRNLSIAHVMKRFGDNSYGILFLTDDDNRICGSITDGDIRRHLLSGGSLEDNVMTAATKDPKIARTMNEAVFLYERNDYVVIPIINDNREIVDLYKGEESENRKHLAKLQVPVVINAGGRGLRLDPFTRVLPKPLIPVGEVPIIELIMREFQKFECNDFHIIVNYKRELMKSYFADAEYGYDITWYDEYKPLGTVGGLSLLKGKIQNTFFFSNCDILLHSDYERILRFHKDNNNDITMVCAKKNLLIPYGVVETDGMGNVENIREKPTIPFMTNTGFYVMEPEITLDLEDDISFDFNDLVEREIKRGRKVSVLTVDEEEWMDMGQISELEKMREKLYGKKE